MTDLGPLRDAGPATTRDFLESTSAEDLVAAIRAATDDDLLGVVGREEVRSVVVEVILRRLHEYAVPSRVAALCGVVRFDLTLDDVVAERRALEFREGRITLIDPETPADVVLTTGLVRFMRLVGGEHNAGLEYLAGTLAIHGDAALALGVGGIFTVPGTDQVAIDPTRLDPVDVATVLKGVSAEHLRTVMASDFRPVVLGEIFRRLPDYLNGRKARGVDLTVGFRLLGNPSGAVERYVVRVRDGVATVATGDAVQPDERDATVTCEGHDYLRLATGHLSPVVGVLTGALKVKGDKAKALKLSSIIDFPTAR
ncbi:MAG TPA: SCP2 sterol-binding domain-containing protein [Nocardioides sp.]|uniref:SCP2 sterol-binding domain-containing protein n=1 Tax=Nocardioides sp. TaxID=35761 RepID=UPI002F4016AB